jgi:hypothetical protein
MSDPGRAGRSGPTKTRVDGEEAVLHITDQSVLFEKGGKVSGFERSAIRLVKPDDDAMVIAYMVGSEVRSVRVEPMDATLSLLAPSSASPSGTVLTSATGLDQAFEKLYRDAWKDLEERLDRINKEPEDRSLRLSRVECERYIQIRGQMRQIMNAKYKLNPNKPSDTPMFLGLERKPQDRQLDTIKILHIDFLRFLAEERAELNDVAYKTEDVWPEEWDIALTRFALSQETPPPTERWKNYLAYLRPKWTRYVKGNKTPVLARP